MTGREEQEVRRALAEDILTTPGRVTMWNAIDGKTGSPDLAKVAKVSDRAAQLLAKELLDAGLVRAVAGARGTVVERTRTRSSSGT